ncbi:MAG: ketoacyl-ACP synthase III [Deltaproteobacteria bacterium]|nr:ketoacyl-ACP synthase III [Deltaproteobacteria bacterium]
MKILSVASALPRRRVDNSELATTLGIGEAALASRVGTTERRYVGGEETGAKLLASASDDALAQAGRTREQVRAIVASTVTPDHQFPGNAAFLQKEWALPGAAILDARACDGGFLHSLDVARTFIDAGTFDLVLLAACDLFSTYLRHEPEGASVTPWFGDGAAACVLAPCDDDSGILALEVGNDPAHVEAFWAKDPGTYVRPRMTRETIEKGLWHFTIDMDAMARETARLMPAICRRALEKAGVGASDVSIFIGSAILPEWGAAVADELGIPRERVPATHDSIGYCGTALLPINIERALRSGRVKSGDVILAASVGAGIAFGAMVYRV